MRVYSAYRTSPEEKEMTEFICERIPSEYRMRWADLSSFWDEATGWYLIMEVSDEHVTLEEVYGHFRRKEMSALEFRRWFEYQEYRSKAFRLELEVAALQEGRSDPPHILTAHDIVDYYQGKISLRLAYIIMDKCEPVRAEGKRLVTAESFDDYLRATQNAIPEEPPETPNQGTPATNPKQRRPPAGDGFEFFRFPH